MKTEFLKLVKTTVAPIALAIAMAAFGSTAALAQGHGGGHGGGRGFSGGHGGGYSGGRSFAAPRNFGGGRGYYGGGRGGYYGGRGYYGGGYYGGRGYYGPGFGFGIYAPYGYTAPVCNPSGFYDQYGNWQVYPGCAVPYGY